MNVTGNDSSVAIPQVAASIVQNGLGLLRGDKRGKGLTADFAAGVAGLVYGCVECRGV